MKNRPSNRRAWISMSFLVSAIAVGLGGCSSGSGVIEEGPEYPARASSGSVDIQVVRDETVVHLTNTTAHALPAGRLWVNRWYSHAFAGLGVGESVTMDLSEFKDHYGERFRAGGFFATDRPTKLVQMQLETESDLIGFVVVGAEE